MKISTKGRYALRILLDMAEHRDDGYIPLKIIAERQAISKNYLDQIMMLLNHTDFLQSTRGSQGGYKLAKTPDSYSVGEILRATEGSITPLACIEDGGANCARYAECLTRPIWQGLDDVISSYLDNLTLQDILDRHAAAFSAKGPAKRLSPASVP